MSRCFDISDPFTGRMSPVLDCIRGGVRKYLDASLGIEGVPAKRFKIMGILRDALRQKSMGIIEEIPEKGIVKYAKPVGVIASLVPVTNASLTESGNGIYALKCKDAIIFSPHPASKKTTFETVRI